MTNKSESDLNTLPSSKTSTPDIVLSNEVFGLKKTTSPKIDSEIIIPHADISLPTSVKEYTDKYFSRTLQILQEKNINPTVRAQVFIRKGPGKVSGVTEALTLINECSDFFKNGGKAWALPDGDEYQSKDTVMLLEGKLCDFVELETLYLGVICRAITAENDQVSKVDLDSVTSRMKEVVDASGNRPVVYFGARHWHWEEDAAIGQATFAAGATGASTDSAAKLINKSGVGTIPHVLENAFAHLYGKDSAVVESTLAFDQVIDPEVPRIALIDYNNKEITDSLDVADALQGKLWGVRVDTCGENVMQGAVASYANKDTKDWKESGAPLISSDHPHAKYWVGNGVTVTGVYALRKALDAAGHQDVKIILTSGFGNAEKVKAFVFAEKLFGVKLFDQLGVGELYHTRTTTMDVVSVQNTDGTWSPLSKVGRGYRPNKNLQPVRFANK